VGAAGVERLSVRTFRLVVTGLALLALPALAPLARAHDGPLGLPAAGTPVEAVDLTSIPGAQALDGGGLAVPVRAARPDWLTDDLLVHAAKGPTRAPSAAQPVGPDVPLSGYVGIRPGSEMLAPYGCTMNFVFQKSGVYAIGTAGHCVDKVGDPVTLLTIAPGDPVSPDNLVLVTIGSAIARVENGVGSDFALISLKPEFQSWVFPTIPVVAGPCGAYTGNGVTQVGVPIQGHATADPGEELSHYGHGTGIGTAGTPRTGHALYWETDAYWWAETVVFGDSGSAARIGTTGLGAAGDVTHIVVDTRHIGATAAGTRITKILKVAKGWSLVNSPHCV